MDFSSEALENMKVYEFADNKGDWNMIGLEGPSLEKLITILPLMFDIGVDVCLWGGTSNTRLQYILLLK